MDIEQQMARNLRVIGHSVMGREIYRLSFPTGLHRIILAVDRDPAVCIHSGGPVVKTMATRFSLSRSQPSA